MKLKLLLITIALFVGFGRSYGQIAIPSSAAVTQNFDGIGNSATATLPTGIKVNTTENYSTGLIATTLAAGTSGTGALTGSSSGGVYNFANGVTASSTDRALGFLTSGGFTSPRSIIIEIKNTGSTNITDLTIAFDYEKYRSGTRAFDWTFFHGATATSVNTAATAGNQSYAADANNTVINNPPTTTSKSVSLTGLSIAPNGLYYLCWTFTGVGGSSNGQGIGIDNLSLTATFVSVCTPPTAQATAFTSSSITGTTATIGWTRPSSGGGNNVLVVARSGSAVNADPTNGTTYSANAAFGSGTQIGTGNYVVYKGNGSSVNLTGLTAGTAYHFAIYEYNDTYICHNITGLTGNFTTAAPILAITPVTTNLGTSCSGTATTGVQYTITNTGTVAATGVTVVSSGTHNSNFVVSGAPTTVAAGGTATYTVTFTPSAPGARSATITVASTTVGSNSPTTALTGTGTTTVAQAVTSSSGATAISQTTATLNGNVTTLGVCPATTLKGFVYSVTATNGTPTNGGTGVTTTAGVAVGAIGVYSSGIIGLTSNTNYSYRAYVFNGTTYDYGGTFTFTTTGPPVVSNGSFSGNVGIAITTFNLSSLATNSPTSYAITGGALPSGLTLNTGNGQITGTPTTNGSFSITFTATNGVGSSASAATVSITINGSLNSDIIGVVSSEAATISSLENDATITTTADGEQVWQFTIRDGGSINDGDTLPTIVNSIVLTQNVGNAIQDWSDAIQAAALFNGTTKIADGAVITNQITFSGVPLISVPDGGSVTLSVRLSIQTSPNNSTFNTDGDDFVFNVQNANVTASTAGSGFSAFPVASSTNDQNVLSVVATKLFFTQQPTSTSLNGAMATVKVTATDANNNVDLGYTGTVSITSTGTMNSSPQTATAVAGVASFTSIVHSVVGTGRALSATATGLTSATSTSFDITSATIYSKGDFAVIGLNSNFFTCASAPYNTIPYQSGDDEVSFIVFKDIQNGDVFYITDNGYERTTAGLWGDTEGVYQVIRTGTTLPSGTVITFRLLNNTTTIAESVSPDTNWSFTKVSGFTAGNVVMNTGGDQLFFMQGGAWTNPAGTHDATYTPGTYLYGFNTNTTWQSLGSSTQKSGLPIELNCFNLLPGSASDFIEYTGSTTAAAKLDWIARLNNPSNWTDRGSCAGYTRTHVGQTYSVLTTGTYVDGVWTGAKSTDWFDCSNWQTLEVPDELVNVNVNTTYATIDAVVNATSTKAATYGSIAKCNNLTISSNKVLVEASANNKLEVHGNLLINTAGALDMDDSTAAADGQLYLYGNWTNSRSKDFFLEGNGTVHFLGSTPQIINNNVHSNPEEFPNVVLDNNFDTKFSNNLIANGDLTVNAGKIVTVSPSDYLKVQNGLKNNGTVNILSNDNSQTGSLVQINDSDTNTGNIKFERTTTVILSTDYTYWSSPVINQTLQTVSPDTFSDKFYVYNASVEDWENVVNPSTYKMVAGKGYIFLGPKTYTAPSLFKTTFIGKPNNGKVEIPIVFNSGAPDGTSNLIGNPYPSAIYADKFLDFNTGVIDGTIYFWTHNTSMQLASNIVLPAYAGSGALAYTSDDYASYNSLGGVRAVSGNSGIKNNNIPNGNIAAGQAFFASGLITGVATFNNSMRIDNLGKIMDNSQFFKTKSPKTKTAAIEKHRIWLNLTNPQGVFKQTLIGYITDATNQYDTRFDGISFDANEFADFYSLSQDKNLVIQGRAVPFDENDQVPLGFRTTIEGAFTINIDQADGILTNQAVFIEDKLTNTTFDLRSGPFTFNTAAGTFNDRFVLRYTNKTLGTTNFESVENQILVYNKNKQIKVNSKAETIDKVSVYDLLGRQLFKKDKVNSNELTIANLVSSQQTLLIKVILQNGQMVTKKIIY
jgi:hypothetical protein